MDCVNHSGYHRICLLPELRQGSLRRLRAQRGWGTGSLRAVLHGMAALSTTLRPGSPSGPNPTAAAVLGLIPGVGAMYNGQFFKGLIHVVIFAVLVSITEHPRNLRHLHRCLGYLPVF